MAQTSRFTPQEIADGNFGVRPSADRLLKLVDTADPAFPQIVAVLKDMQAGGVELNEAAVTIAVQLGQQKHLRSSVSAVVARKPCRDTPVTKGIVYYIRRGEAIKIGTTTSPVRRFRALMPDEILAFEPGDRTLEAERHNQFSRLRMTAQQEYFTAAPDLLAHIGDLRNLHGAPDPSWPTLGRANPRRNVELPPPATLEMVSVAEGCERLGIKKGTFHGWVHRGRLSSVGYNSRGHQLFYLDHLRYLAQLNSPWTGWADDAGALTA